MTSPKIIATADLHGSLPEIPKADVLIIAGDICPMFSHDLEQQLGWLDTNFRSWLDDAQQKVKSIIGIAGNHDFVFEKRANEVDKLQLPWIYLKDEGVTIRTFTESGAYSFNVWGSPWVPNLARWAFHDTDHGLDARLAAIPENIDLVISHGPPHGYCDLTVPRFGGVHAGFPGTNQMLNRVKPAAFVCGHIHEGYGTASHPSGATVYNVSHNTELYDPINAPKWISLDSNQGRAGLQPTALPS